MKSLPVVWKRLVKDGETCNRCGSTFDELEAALEQLTAALRPLDIEPTLETQELDQSAFAAQPAESNRVWIAGRPLEDWLGARVGMTRCCSVCGDSDCRTLDVDGKRYEIVPRELFVKAGLMAASQLLGQSAANESGTGGCVPGGCGCHASSAPAFSTPTATRSSRTAIGGG